MRENEWHYHLQVTESDSEYPLFETIHTETTETVDAFIGMIQSFDGDKTKMFEDEEYAALAVDEFISRSIEGHTLGLYCNVGDLSIRIFNCYDCPVSVLN